MPLPRLLGGLLFAVGAVALFLREVDDWADFPILLVVLVPFALLYGLGMSEPIPAPWRSVFLVGGVLLAPFVLFQLVDTIGGNPDAGLNEAWIFLVTAGLAAAASFRRGAAYQALLMALALAVAWLSLWGELLDDPSDSAFRWLLVVIALAFLGAATRLRTARLSQGEELVTAAAIAGVAAGAFTLLDIGGLVEGVFNGEPPDEPGTFWELELVAVSAAAIAYGSSAGFRGPSYVGTFGFAAFLVITGFGLFTEDVGGLVGWPLVLLLLGAAALAASYLLPPGAAGSAVPAAPPPRAGEPGDAVAAEQT